MKRVTATRNVHRDKSAAELAIERRGRSAVELAIGCLQGASQINRPGARESPITDERIVEVVRMASDRLLFVEMMLRGMAAQAETSVVPQFALQMVEEEVSRIGAALHELGGVL